MSVATGTAQPRSAPPFQLMQVDQRRRDHPAQRGQTRQHPPPPRRQLPVQELALDLQPDQQEERRHQQVVDPVQDVERPDIGLEQREIAVRQRAVGDDQRQRRRRDQHQPAARLAAQQRSDHRAERGRMPFHLLIQGARSPSSNSASNDAYPKWF
jgi:hypothetical protein